MKKIEDYLHLYLGCPFVLKIEETDTLSGTMFLDADALAAAHTNNSQDKIYPLLLLRPLSDMTEEEVKHICKILGAWIPDTIFKRMKGENWAQWYYFFDEKEEIIANFSTDEKGFSVYRGNDYFHLHIQVFYYLLSLHIDLFGLIDAGLALDATKQLQK